MEMRNVMGLCYTEITFIFNVIADCGFATALGKGKAKMATRSRDSFQKRQKELQRMEKQRDKQARRLARKNAPKETGEVEPEAVEEGAELPEGAQLPEGADADAQ